MINRPKLLIAIGLIPLLLPASTFACPVGSVAVKGNGWEGCVPGPAASEEDSGPRYKAQWGAIATDGPNAVLGTASEMLNKRSAQKAALAMCQKKGGVNCTLDLTYTNHCAVMVAGNSRHFILSAPTLEQATELGMDHCNKNVTGCRVFYSACSLPLRVR